VQPFQSRADDAPQLARAAQALREAQQVVLCTHISPDPDGIGSELALAHALHAMGKRARIVNVDGCPRICRGLVGADGIERWRKEALEQADLVVALDVATKRRLGWPEGFGLSAPLLNIDHHRSNELFGQINWVDPAYPATGAMVFDLLFALGVTIDAPMADALYLALMADTNGFRARISPSVHRMAASLIEAGAQPARLARTLFGSRRVSSARLLGALLAKMTLRDQGRSAWLIADAALVQQLGADWEDFEGIVEQALAIEGVEVAVLLRPLEDGCYKASLRSWGIDVGSLAARFGGGGHPQAAGCAIASDAIPALQQAVSALLA